jgi:hypothetical protein
LKERRTTSLLLTSWRKSRERIDTTSHFSDAQ